MSFEIININCPKCNKPLKYISYNVPDDIYYQLYRNKEVFFGNNYNDEKYLELDKQLKYHCFNCNKSYSSDLRRSIDEEYDINHINSSRDYIEHIIEMMSKHLFNIIDLNDKYSFIKGRYNYKNLNYFILDHYLYFMGHNMIINYDYVSRRIYDEMMKKLKKYKFPKYDYIYVSVCYYDELYNSYDGYTYYYKTDIKDIYKENIVLVDRAGKKVKGKVEKVEYFKKKDVPYPLNKTKDIIEIIAECEEEDEIKKEKKSSN